MPSPFRSLIPHLRIKFSKILFRINLDSQFLLKVTIKLLVPLPVTRASLPKSAGGMLLRTQGHWEWRNKTSKGSHSLHDKKLNILNERSENWLLAKHNTTEGGSTVTAERLCFDLRLSFICDNSVVISVVGVIQHPLKHQGAH